jgi:hypothetical protein
MAKMIDPLIVQCPSCDAPVGIRCWSRTRRGRHLARGSHPDRRRLAAGETVSESFGAFLRRELRRATAEVVVNARKKT